MISKVPECESRIKGSVKHALCTWELANEPPQENLLPALEEDRMCWKEISDFIYIRRINSLIAKIQVKRKRLYDSRWEEDIGTDAVGAFFVGKLDRIVRASSRWVRVRIVKKSWGLPAPERERPSLSTIRIECLLRSKHGIAGNHTESLRTR